MLQLAQSRLQLLTLFVELGELPLDRFDFAVGCHCDHGLRQIPYSALPPSAEQVVPRLIHTAFVGAYRKQSSSGILAASVNKDLP